MAERLEDLNLPVTAITRIAKEVLPSNIIVSKEAKTAMARAASVFILYVSNQATTIATSKNKKTISAQDVLEALSQVDFDCLMEPLQQLLEGWFTISQCSTLYSFFFFFYSTCLLLFPIPWPYYGKLTDDNLKNQCHKVYTLLYSVLRMWWFEYNKFQNCFSSNL